jgi:hypothetical protein
VKVGVGEGDGDPHCGFPGQQCALGDGCGTTWGFGAGCGFTWIQVL